MTTIGAADARKSFADVIERAQSEPVFVKRHGRTQAVVVSQAQYELMADALDEAEDAAAFDAAMSEEGPNIPWEQVKSDLGWA